MGKLALAITATVSPSFCQLYRELQGNLHALIESALDRNPGLMQLVSSKSCGVMMSHLGFVGRLGGCDEVFRALF